MKNKKLDYISSCLIILNGLACVVYGEKLLPLVPIVCGGSLLIKGIIKFIEGIKDKDYLSLEKINLENSILLIAVGIGILIRRSDSLFIVGVFWGIHGLTRSSKYLNIGLYNIFNKKRWKLVMFKAVTEFILSIILIFDPFSSIGHHIVILGIELLFDGAMDFIKK